jgi:hypothetical protein
LSIVLRELRGLTRCERYGFEPFVTGFLSLTHSFQPPSSARTFSVLPAR